jgi:hypothetical protein
MDMMKRWIILLTLLSLMLCACSSEPVQTTTPAETTPTVPVSIATKPSETTIPSEPVPETEPSEAPESTAPPESTEASVDTSYTIQIADPETYIYEKPEFRSQCTALVGEAGIYTIVEEAMDRDGNLWGRLKSGIGWVCLTEPAIVPVYADYAPEHFSYVDSWHCGEPDYVTDIGIIPMEPIRDVEFVLLNVIENNKVEDVLYTADALNAEDGLLISVVYWGDMTTYGLNFTDMNGNTRCFALSISGKDGSLICREYTPE